MDDRTTKVSAVGDSSVRGEVGKILVAESEDFALGGKEGKFVFAGLRESRELDALSAVSVLRVLLMRKKRPLISVPVLGVICVIDAPEDSNSGILGSASRARSWCSKGSR